MSEDKAHILIIDDDERIRELMGQFLSENNLLVSKAASAAEARRKMRSIIFDLLVLDIMMPEETGIDFIQCLEKEPERPPVLMLTALSKTQERIEGLEAGADDYLPKPFEPKELLLRIQKLLQRTKASAPPSIKMGAVIFENDVLTTLDGNRVFLSQGEVELLNLLAAHQYKIVSRETIAKHCNLENVRAADVRINRLRQKIEREPKNPLYLQTARGVGYILKPE